MESGAAPSDSLLVRAPPARIVGLWQPGDRGSQFSGLAVDTLVRPPDNPRFDTLRRDGATDHVTAAHAIAGLHLSLMQLRNDFRQTEPDSPPLEAPDIPPHRSCSSMPMSRKRTATLTPPSRMVTAARMMRQRATLRRGPQREMRHRQAEHLALGWRPERHRAYPQLIANLER